MSAVVDPVNPSHSHTLLQTAVDHHRAGRLDEAEKIYQQLPAIPKVLYFRGLVAFQKGDFARAVELAHLAATLAPDKVEAHHLAAMGCYRSDRFTEAIGYFQRALAIKPDDVALLGNFCLALVEEQRFDEAEQTGRRAVTLNPNVAESQNSLGMALAFQGKTAEAETCFRNALTLDPKCAAAWKNLGAALKEQGRFDEARTAYQTLLQINPRDGAALQALSGCGRVTPADLTSWSAHTALLTDSTATTQDRALAHYAFGKMNEDIGNYDAAFALYQRGNDLLRVPYDRTGQEQFFADQMAYFTRSCIAARAQHGHPSDKPIFIVGMARSGTTLVEQVLASHPDVHAAGELRDIPMLVRDIHLQSEDGRPFPLCLDAASAEQIDRWALRYLTAREKHSGQAKRIVDKMPSNFTYLGLISMLFPGARIIHCRRDPRDVCVSLLTNHFNSGITHSFDQVDAAHFYRQYERLMAHWRDVLPRPMLEVQYEDLVSEQETVTRAILDFCGLPWDERCLRYYETRRPVQTVSVWQVRQPLYHSSIGRWQRFAKHLGPMLEELGRNG